jgi:transcriptional regulator with XRE-family HTH domain
VNRFQGQLSNLIRSRRQELGLTQAKVAKACGVTADLIGLAESGMRRIALDRIPLLADVLELPRAELCVLALAERAPALCAEIIGGSQRGRHA